MLASSFVGYLAIVNTIPYSLTREAQLKRYCEGGFESTFCRQTFISFIHAVNIYWALSMCWVFSEVLGVPREPGCQDSTSHETLVLRKGERKKPYFRKRVRNDLSESMISKLNPEGWERKRVGESVPERGTISHCCLRHCNGVFPLVP